VSAEEAREAVERVARELMVTRSGRMELNLIQARARARAKAKVRVVPDGAG